MQNIQKKEMQYFPSPPRSLSDLEKEIQTIQQHIKDLEKFK